MAALPNAENVEREIREIEKRISAFKLEIAQANGSLETVTNRVRTTQKDLKQDKYRKVEHEHRKPNHKPDPDH
jgi:chromosome segregation ATPase